jgi:hypothetical protein
MESKRGRPSAKLLDKYSFDLDKISNYFKENIKEQPKPEQEQPKPEQEQPKPEQEQLNRAIVFDKNMLIKADILVSAILESGLNLIGVKKEVLPINEKEADLLIEIMPPIQLEKNWTNFFLAYLTLKIVK